MKTDQDIGKAYLHGRDQVWRMTGICRYPTVTFENLTTKESKTVELGSKEEKRFRELSPRDPKVDDDLCEDRP